MMWREGESDRWRDLIGRDVKIGLEVVEVKVKMGLPEAMVDEILNSFVFVLVLSTWLFL